MLILFYKQHKSIMPLSFPASCDNMIAGVQQLLTKRNWSPMKEQAGTGGGREQSRTGELQEPPPTPPPPAFTAETGALGVERRERWLVGSFVQEGGMRAGPRTWGWCAPSRKDVRSKSKRRNWAGCR